MRLTKGYRQIEYLTRCFEGLPSQCAFHQLWDFAFAGADIDPTMQVHPVSSTPIGKFTPSLETI